MSNSAHLPQRIKLSVKALEEIACIAQNTSLIQPFSEILAKQGFSTKVSEALAQATSKLQPKSDVLREILNAFISLHSLRFDLHAEPDALYDAICVGLREQAPEEWKRAYEKSWREGRSEILNGLSDSSGYALVAKKIRLTYSHQNILMKAEVISDIRPVFNPSGSNISGYVLTHMLMLDYFDGQEPQRIHVAIDALDIENIKRAFIRAEEKTKTVAKEFKAANLNLSIPRSDSNE